ncbi:MAG: FHA domain-containing protein [Planctomycetes bacterium]|nr:FHA domain-containing protein [Planctomycetota bacterium]
MARRSWKVRAKRARPRLLSPSGAQIELAAGRDYVLGRGRDCDIVLDDLLSSRHHARLAVRGEVAITDLASRNGTFVDDARIEEETPVAHGSRIRVGASIYLLSTAAGPDAVVDTGTVALEQMTLGRDVDEGVLRSVRDERSQGGLAGQLDAFGLVDILQGLLQAGRAGTLHVALPSGHARVEVRRGEVHDASCGEARGLDALVALAKEKVGVFWLADAEADCERTIDEPSGRLLYVLCRSLD